jgi:sec-independent protein translocase protein TatB
MFGIGLPELILIMAVALIVVGPDKLPELAKSLGKGIVELKKAASGLKDSLNEVDEETPAWSQEEIDKHPNKLLEAYKDLPEDAIAEKFEEVIPEESEAESESAAATEEVSEESGTESGATAATVEVSKESEAESVAATEEVSQSSPAKSETGSTEKKSDS